MPLAGMNSRSFGEQKHTLEPQPEFPNGPELRILGLSLRLEGTCRSQYAFHVLLVGFFLAVAVSVMVERSSGMLYSQHRFTGCPLEEAESNVSWIRLRQA